MSTATPDALSAPTTERASPPPLRRKPRGQWARRGPLLPALVFMIIVTQLPFVATLAFSVWNWNAYRPEDRHFTGLSNYKTVFTDPTVRSAVFTSVVMTVTVVLVALLIGFGIALLLDKKFFGRGVVRTVLIAPFLVVPVAAALLFKHGIYNPTYGLINGTLTGVWRLFGSDNPPQVDLLTTHARLAVEAELVWQWTPFMMLILLAGLQSRDPEILEAARVDGAGAFATFRYMTLPHMRRYLELGALLGTIYIVQNFDSVFTITSGGLGTANLPYTIYETFYQAHDYGLASAQGVVVVIASIVVATFALRVVSSLFNEEN